MPPFNVTDSINVTLLLPATNITLSTTIFMPQQSKIIGESTGGQVTNLIASNALYFTGLPGSNCDASGTSFCYPMICMGGPLNETTGLPDCGTPSFGTSPPHFTNTPRIQIENVQMDCNMNANCANVVNTTAQEKSWVQNSTINNISKYGIKIGRTGCQGAMTGNCGSTNPAANQAQNSGPFTNLEMNFYDSTGTCTMTYPINGILVNNGLSVTLGAGGHITMNGPDSCGTSGSTSTTVVAIDINGIGGPIVENIHCEKWYTCVQVGDLGNTYGFFAKGITTAGTTNTAVNVIPSGGNTAVGVIESVFQQGATTIADMQSGNTVTAPQVALYTVGTILNPANNWFNGLAVVNNGNPSHPSLTFANSATFGFYSASTTSIGLGLGSPLNDSHQFTTGGNVNIISGGVFGMSSSSSDAGTAADTGISRNGANITAVGTGGAANTQGTLQVSRLKTGSLAPACTFATGGGVGPSCAFDTGSTDSAGIIIATTGTGSITGAGTITLTFSTPTFGSNKPSCVFMASDASGSAWNGLAVMKDKTPVASTSDTFTFTNGTGPTPLSVSTAYWINYHCWAK